jgi:hypothetical protein
MRSRAVVSALLLFILALVAPVSAQVNLKPGSSVAASVSGKIWSSTTTYHLGDVVFGAITNCSGGCGGIWQATGTSTGSQPVSGNTNWAFIDGIPYVYFSRDPVQLTTAPYYDPTLTGPGVTVIPAPGAGLTVMPFLLGTGRTSAGDAWGTGPALNLGWVSPGASLDPFFNTLAGGLERDLSVLGPVTVGYIGTTGENEWGPPPGVENQPIVGWTTEDATSGGIGSRSVIYRIGYIIFPSGLYVPATVFFTITGVNQGLKTFTVSPDPTGTTGSVTVVGSPACNDGPYTVASVTATTIVVNEAIPCVTANGWVKK